jgi:hypothetical protein
LLVGLIIRVGGLILSIKWLVKLDGYTKTSGRQAIAIFLIVFCGYGLLLLGFGLTIRFNATGSLLGLLYVAGLLLCVRWVKKLRQSDGADWAPRETGIGKPQIGQAS